MGLAEATGCPTGAPSTAGATGVWAALAKATDVWGVLATGVGAEGVGKEVTGWDAT